MFVNDFISCGQVICYTIRFEIRKKRTPENSKILQIIISLRNWIYFLKNRDHNPLRDFKLESHVK